MTIVAGTTVGGYRVVETLGRGGMATVYKAYEAGPDRYVALKVLPSEFLHDPVFADRFRREARLIARLEHPAIVPLYAYGVDEQVPWMAMKLVEGGPLSSLLRAGRLDPERAVSILRGVAEALEFAHSQGVIHRDVKPHNVLLEEARVFLADFGVARAVEGSTLVTPTGLLVGTPEYMAPEQARGASPDGRSDTYALGVIAYEMLTGRVPFTAATPMAVLIKHLLEPIPAPRKEDVPEPVARALLKCLAKHPEDRWESPTAFVRALERAAAVSAVARTRVMSDRPPARVAAPDAPTLVQAERTERSGVSGLEAAGLRVLRVDHPWYPPSLASATWQCAKRLGVPVAVEDVATGIALVLVPDGEFWMGASADVEEPPSEERPRRRVVVRAFYLGIGPVTQEQWQRVIPMGESRFRGATRPMENVSWNDTLAFLERANRGRQGPLLRRPTEAEWERAARGGTQTSQWWGTEHHEGMANCAEPRVFSFGSTSAVGQYAANAFGLLDVLGNVWEWCQDRWHPDLRQVHEDGRAVEHGNERIRVARGGAWDTKPNQLRVSARLPSARDNRRDDIGLRCALDIPA
jgi:formylglycine-generating enzyme required for sulfatase activity/predicted Ser/Thr protein kinase